MASLSFVEFLHRFPKVDLHYHLLGGVRLETMRSLAAKFDALRAELEQEPPIEPDHHIRYV